MEHKICEAARKLMANRIANTELSYNPKDEWTEIWVKHFKKAMKWCDKRICKEYDKLLPYFAPYWNFETSEIVIEDYTDEGYNDTIHNRLVPYDEEGWTFSSILKKDGYLTKLLEGNKTA